jgi:hypothetical protein
MDKEKKEDKKDEERKEEKVELNNVQSSIEYYKRLAGRALERGDDKGAFRCLQQACSSGMSAIKFVARNAGNGFRTGNGRLDNMKEEERDVLKEFVADTRDKLDEMDFDDKERFNKFKNVMDHFVGDLNQPLGEGMKATQTFFFSNWLDDVGDILSDIEEKLILLRIYEMTRTKSVGEQMREHLSQRVREELDYGRS